MPQVPEGILEILLEVLWIHGVPVVFMCLEDSTKDLEVVKRVFLMMLPCTFKGTSVIV